MPTKAEFQELLDNTNSEWIADYDGTGVSGRKFTSKTNGNSIFIPAAGCCGDSSVDNVGRYGYVWSSSLSTANLATAWRSYFYSGDCGVNYYGRYYGQSVRGVRK